MPHIWLWFIIIFGVVLQTTVVPFLQVGNARPDLLLMLTVSVGLIFGQVAGVSVGFFSGLLWDLLTAQFFGMYTLAKILTGYLIGCFEKKVFKEHPILPLATIFLATFVHEGILYIGTRMLDIEVPLLPLIGKNVLPNAVYNCVVMPFIYFAVLRFRSVIWSAEKT